MKKTIGKKKIENSSVVIFEEINLIYKELLEIKNLLLKLEVKFDIEETLRNSSKKVDSEGWRFSRILI